MCVFPAWSSNYFKKRIAASSEKDANLQSELLGATWDLKGILESCKVKELPVVEPLAASTLIALH